MAGELAGAALHVPYLDFDGVLHPDAVYRTRNGIELLHHPGHRLRWVAVDDSPEEWPAWARDNVVLADPELGIAAGAVHENAVGV